MAKRKELSEAASLLGRRSYEVRLERFGLEKLQQIARENGARNEGRPPERVRCD